MPLCWNCSGTLVRVTKRGLTRRCSCSYRGYVVTFFLPTTPRAQAIFSAKFMSKIEKIALYFAGGFMVTRQCGRQAIE
jgi:hypothetical protein